MAVSDYANQVMSGKINSDNIPMLSTKDLPKEG